VASIATTERTIAEMPQRSETGSAYCRIKAPNWAATSADTASGTISRHTAWRQSESMNTSPVKKSMTRNEGAAIRGP